MDIFRIFFEFWKIPFKKKFKAVILELLVQGLGKFASVIGKRVTKRCQIYDFVDFPTFKNFKKIYIDYENSTNSFEIRIE